MYDGNYDGPMEVVGFYCPRGGSPKHPGHLEGYAEKSSAIPLFAPGMEAGSIRQWFVREYETDPPDGPPLADAVLQALGLEPGDILCGATRDDMTCLLPETHVEAGAWHVGMGGKWSLSVMEQTIEAEHLAKHLDGPILVIDGPGFDRVYALLRSHQVHVTVVERPYVAGDGHFAFRSTWARGALVVERTDGRAIEDAIMMANVVIECLEDGPVLSKYRFGAPARLIL